MPDNDDDVTVTVEPAEGSAPVPDVVEKVAPAVTPDADDPQQALAEQLRAAQAETETERGRRTQAEQIARNERAHRERETQAARAEIADRELDTITAALSAVTTEAQAAEAEYKTAFEAGDAAAITAAQRKLARAEARAVNLEEAKANAENARQNPALARTEGRVTQPQPATPADDFDRYLGNFTPATAQWLRGHQEWVTDQRKNAKLMAAHHDAVSENMAPDTPEYFAHVEKFIGLRQEPKPAAPAAKPNGNGATPARRSSAPAAPVVQTGGGVGGDSGTEVRLSKTEAQAATDGTHVWNYEDPSPQKRFRKGDPIGVQEFARRKLEMTKQGLYDRVYVEQ